MFLTADLRSVVNADFSFVLNVGIQLVLIESYSKMMYPLFEWRDGFESLEITLFGK